MITHGADMSGRNMGKSAAEELITQKEVDEMNEELAGSESELKKCEDEIYELEKNLKETAEKSEIRKIERELGSLQRDRTKIGKKIEGLEDRIAIYEDVLKIAARIDKPEPGTKPRGKSI